MPVNAEYAINEIYTDFEIAIGEGCKNVYPDCKIKYCIWNMKYALKNDENKLCFDEVNNDNEIFILYNITKNLYLCDHTFIEYVFKKIKDSNDNKNFFKILDYFKSENIKKI